MGSASSSQLGSKSTAEDVAAAFPDAVRGKTALVTGGYSGLGFETARVLAANGAKVVLAGRSQQAGDEAVQKLKALAPAADVSFLRVDLADIKQTTAAAAAFAKSGKPLHLLLNNAGVMACPKGLTKDGIETQMGTNHIGEPARGGAACYPALLLAAGAWCRVLLTPHPPPPSPLPHRRPLCAHARAAAAAQGVRAVARGEPVVHGPVDLRARVRRRL
jgi:NAD(P)-dependent dehydrogenase (short-subunit alcohol dehydrogenase family)